MIQLGLSRISRLFDAGSISWKAIHVAGTNGKGSVCAYAAAMLALQGLKVGRFTSPHMIDRWDCIEINGNAIEGHKFSSVLEQITAKNERLRVSASEFEILTATAFEIFNQERIEVGVIEVGMGGRTDATNIIRSNNVLATAITKISMDHKSFLGDTIHKVAWQKAGILKSGVPCFYDSTNSREVVSALETERDRVGLGQLHSKSLVGVSSKVIKDIIENYSTLDAYFPHEQPADQQFTAMSLALAAVEQSLVSLDKTGILKKPIPSQHQLTEAIRHVKWDGRLQKLSIEVLTGRVQPVLLDGAHNLDASVALAQYVNARLRQPGSGSYSPVTWVYASSTGKDIQAMSKRLFKTGDTVITTKFGPVDGMPWVKAEAPVSLLEVAKQSGELNAASKAVDDVKAALQRAATESAEGPLVIAGSVYLAADVLRLLKKHKKPLKPV